MSWFSALGAGSAGAGASASGAGSLLGGSVSMPGSVAGGATGMGVLMPQAAGPAVGGFSVAPTQVPAAGAIPTAGGGLSSMTNNAGGAAGIVSGIAEGITAMRIGRANARMAMTAATSNANRIYAQMREIAGRGRAVAGAQGSGGGGTDYMTYLRNLTQAVIAARTEIYKGQVAASAAKYNAKQGLFSGISRAGTSLMSMGRS